MFSDGVWIPWRQRAEKLPDPAAAAPLSDYRSERLHAVELAHSKKTHTHTNAETHPRQQGMQHSQLEVAQHTNMLRSKMKEC